MIFKYEKNRLKEYRKSGINMVLIVVCIFIPITLISIFSMLEYNLLLIFIEFIILAISAGIGILIGYKKAKKEFESFQIECGDEDIIITSKMQHKKININKIVKIQKDNKNNYYIIFDKINKLKILHYIENIKEFEKYLNNIYLIEKYNEKYNIFEYIPVIFYFALMFISKFGNMELYIIFAFVVLITVIYSLIKLLLSQFKFKLKIIGFIVYGYILCGVIYGIYNGIKYLRN